MSAQPLVHGGGALLDREGFSARHQDEAGLGAFRLGHVFAQRVEDFLNFAVWYF